MTKLGMASMAAGDMPKTVEQAVTRLLELLPSDYAEQLAIADKENLIEYHHTLGLQIRNEFGLWRRNEALIEAMRGQRMHADDRSMVIIEALWEELQKRRTRH